MFPSSRKRLQRAGCVGILVLAAGDLALHPAHASISVISQLHHGEAHADVFTPPVDSDAFDSSSIGPFSQTASATRSEPPRFATADIQQTASYNNALQLLDMQVQANSTASPAPWGVPFHLPQLRSLWMRQRRMN